MSVKGVCAPPIVGGCIGGGGLTGLSGWHNSPWDLLSGYIVVSPSHQWSLLHGEHTVSCGRNGVL